TEPVHIRSHHYTQNAPESGSTGKAHSKRTRKQTSDHKVTMSHRNLQHKDDVKTASALPCKATIKTRKSLHNKDNINTSLSLFVLYMVNHV
ncbi:hypothetical protein, partial [Escherichia coli]|uniref:hypothetical protein n=2 Tax=Escherichia coli TaxID=562 RepID=UPI001A7E3310